LSVKEGNTIWIGRKLRRKQLSIKPFTYNFTKKDESNWYKFLTENLTKAKRHPFGMSFDQIKKP
jgi:hypothetical protein